jgi:hypothetical protein
LPEETFSTSYNERKSDPLHNKSLLFRKF